MSSQHSQGWLSSTDRSRHGSKSALILVDLQNDFLPGGALPVPQGSEVISIANKLSLRFKHVIATLDWHPLNHASFAANYRARVPGEIVEINGVSQILWPTHCVQQTTGAQFAPGLDQSRISCVFHKGTDPEIDSYSGFYDNGHRRSTGLGEFLKERAIKELFVMGLATDYCVKFTVLDAVTLGFVTNVVRDGCRAVNLKSGDEQQSIEEMRMAGAAITDSDAVNPTGSTKSARQKEEC